MRRVGKSRPVGWHMSRLHALASERNYISKEPIATCIPIEHAQTLNGTLIGGYRVGGLFEWRMSPPALSPPRQAMTGWTRKPRRSTEHVGHRRGRLFEHGYGTSG